MGQENVVPVTSSSNASSPRGNRKSLNINKASNGFVVHGYAESFNGETTTVALNIEEALKIVTDFFS